MTSLGAFDLIQGTPAPEGDQRYGAGSVPRSRGSTIDSGQRTSSARRCGRRRGPAEWRHVTWTIKQAERLGLVGKDNWRQAAQGDAHRSGNERSLAD
ncbi:MAG: hypothetical protein WKF82_12455 [Nocardioidaceae bacterium]